MLIEFLFKKLKWFIVFLQLPMYVFTLVTFLFLIKVNENYRSSLSIDFTKKKVTGFERAK